MLSSIGDCQHFNRKEDLSSCISFELPLNQSLLLAFYSIVQYPFWLIWSVIPSAESAGNTGEQLNQLKESDHLEVEDNNDPLPVKRKKSSKNGKRIKRVKSKKSKDRVQDNTDDSSS